MMYFKIKKIKIKTGGPLVVYLTKYDCAKLNIPPKSRMGIRFNKKELIAMVDIIDSDFLKNGQVGVLDEVREKLNLKHNDIVRLFHINEPITLNYIKKKLQGERLNKDQFTKIINDIKDNILTEVEITYFVSACYCNPLNLDETIALTKSMVETGKIIKFGSKNVIDKHCIGGVAGNRTTMIVVPILAVAGYVVPKTSSRSITSPAGTADTFEVFTNVDLDISKMKKVVKKTGACITWGGALDLAPADDIIINVEHPLSLDPRGQLIASVLSKKRSVSSNKVLIDIPYGMGSKISSKKDALSLKSDFEKVGHSIGLNVHAVLTDGKNPIGCGLGPVLEAIDVYDVLKNQHDHLKDLIDKSIKLAGNMLELGGLYKKGQGEIVARDILYSNKAFDKFNEIIVAQGGKKINGTNNLKNKLSKCIYEVKSNKSGIVKQIDNKIISKIAKMAGAPSHKGCGVYLLKKQNDKVKKNEILFRVYSYTNIKLNQINNFLKLADPYSFK
ncbi:thymidine phosphorylase family protein [Candidatus Woesearchaeota archaeon]|nr:thymidine phosphorylase family protein [Candidatus Woesearchaeota archaeon]MBT4596207.1 thymidine phosphorylase family protein [Candidatus Woesearchaeota archaeon]MBT5741570.1 thymidine phosphorylase family protein [Candidatus Woesearchaeota archaeon]MBT6505894.1 thymidine phosphorylase family protein [Candidatus Woesearchaeota archaeon]MBT7849344.1 thymidine phosphorylase family protein [Candidatus Woesearchaeota archaeon]